jgi:hypothetical protein
VLNHATNHTPNRYAAAKKTIRNQKMNEKRIQTFTILLRDILIGASLTILIFWLINEIPNNDYLLARLHIWLTIPIGLTLATWLTSKLIYNQLTKQKRNRFLVAFGFFFLVGLLHFFRQQLAKEFWEQLKTNDSKFLKHLKDIRFINFGFTGELALFTD